MTGEWSGRQQSRGRSLPAGVTLQHSSQAYECSAGSTAMRVKVNLRSSSVRNETREMKAPRKIVVTLRTARDIAYTINLILPYKQVKRRPKGPECVYRFRSFILVKRFLSSLPKTFRTVEKAPLCVLDGARVERGASTAAVVAAGTAVRATGAGTFAPADVRPGSWSLSSLSVKLVTDDGLSLSSSLSVKLPPEDGVSGRD